METVLVTGAGGYIGSNAAEYFAKAGYRVVGTIHRHIAERLTRLGIKTIKIDLADAADLSRLFEEKNLSRLFEEKIDYVVHIAARASDVGRDEWFRAANYEAVKSLASVAMEHGVKRFVYLSTADVYGLHDFNGESEEELAFDETVKNPYPKIPFWKVARTEPLAARTCGERLPDAPRRDDPAGGGRGRRDRAGFAARHRERILSRTRGGVPAGETPARDDAADGADTSNRRAFDGTLQKQAVVRSDAVRTRYDFAQPRFSQPAHARMVCESGTGGVSP